MPEAKEAMSDSGRIAKIGNEIGEALGAEEVTVKLLNGDEIAGSLVGYSIRKKPGKGGKEPQPASWAGNIKIQTGPGVLEVDCLTIESITARDEA